MDVASPATSTGLQPYLVLLPPILTGAIMVLVLTGMTRYAKPRGDAEIARAVGLLLSFVCLFCYSALLTDAFDLAEELGNGALYSGMLIGMMFDGGMLGTLVAWLALRHWPSMWRGSPKRVLTMATSLLLAATLGYTSATYNASSLSPQFTSKLLLCFRFTGGIGYGIIQQLTVTTFIHVTPKPERSEQMIRVLFANMLGVGLGPVSNVAAVSIASPVDVAQRFAVGGGVQAVMCFFTLVAVVVIYPSMDAVTDHEEAPKSIGVASQPPGDSTARPASMGVNNPFTRQKSDSSWESEGSTELLESGIITDEDERVQLKHRYIVVTASLAMALIRNLTTASLESATSMMLETKYHWDVRLIGVTIALSFLIAIPFKLVQTIMNKHLTLTTWIRVLTGMATVGSLMMLVTGHSSAVGGGMLILADTLLFPSLYFGDALNRGIMQQHLMPQGSIYDANTTTMWSTLVASGMGRAAGPPLARWCIDMGGQHTYALVQLTSCVLFASLFEGLVRPYMTMKP